MYETYYEPTEQDLKDYAQHCQKEKTMPKTFKWTVEFEIDETWVADGFEMTDERANDMIQNALGWATSSEVKARVLKSPDPKKIRKAQGYNDRVSNPKENEKSAEISLNSLSY